MSKTFSNVPKSKRGGYDMWGKRPHSGRSHSPYNKRRTRVAERRIRKSEMRTLLFGDLVNHPA